MKRQELYLLAKREVARRRQRAESDAIGRKEELYEAMPRLWELDAEKSAAGAAAARLAADGQAEEARRKLLEMRALAEKHKALLKAAGCAERDLAPRYHCAHCGDTGVVDGQVCECVKQEMRSLRREEINKSGPLTLSSFDTFNVELYPKSLEGVNYSPRDMMSLILQECRDYAAEFGPKSQSLYFFGDAGLGKTHMALAIAGQVLEQGFDVIYVSAQSAFAQLAQQRREGVYGELFPSMMEADLLVLDDLGSEFIDAYTLSRLYELVNTRMGRRPTIYTSNITGEDQLHQRYTEKIASRLLGECHKFLFRGYDNRLQDERYRLG